LGVVAYFGVVSDQTEVGADPAGAPLQQDQVQPLGEQPAVAWPDKQDSRRLDPAQLVADGDPIVLRIQVDDLDFHVVRCASPAA
jgi:hypothetical protein